jgi:excisionase family DNA binding protein
MYFSDNKGGLMIYNNNQPTHVLCNLEEINQFIRQAVQEEIGAFSSSLQSAQNQAMSKTEDKLLTRNQLADMLDISLSTIWKRMRNKELPYLRLGKKIYFRESEIQKILQEGGKL